MKIGLIDVDGHNFPNLALMKLSSYHKQVGDAVEWYSGIDHYDRVYMSKVFTFTPDDGRVIQANEIIKGGTGYGIYTDLFCDEVEPDYSLYPISKWYDGKTAYGFLTRGCIRKCPWCIVPQKEGGIRPCRDIETVLQDKKKAILMDNNILACDHGLTQIEKIIKLGCKVDFNQGLDTRLVTDEVAQMLCRVKWISQIRFSCDTLAGLDYLLAAIDKLNYCGVKNYRIFVYVLVRDVEEANFICDHLKKIGVDPFAQPYRDYDGGEPTEEQSSFARYVNRKEIFNSTSWRGYNRKR